MLLPVLLVLALLFGLLFLTRMGGIYRATLMRRWPAVVLAGAAILLLTRGAIGPGLMLGAVAAAAWLAWPSLERLAAPRGPARKTDSREDSAARAVLGVQPGAGADEIRRAYRTKMAQAHPDRGGSHNEAARLTAARDRLLKRTR